MRRQRNQRISVIAATLLLTCAAIAKAQEEPIPSQWAGFCNPSGTWMASSDTGGVFLVTIAPAALGEFSSVTETVAFDPSFGGALPAVDATIGRSSSKRRGLRAFDAVGLRYAWGADLAVVWIEKAVTTTVLNAGCKTGVVDGLFHYYASAQDPFGTEPPAYGTFPGHIDLVRLPSP